MSSSAYSSSGSRIRSSENLGSPHNARRHSMISREKSSTASPLCTISRCLNWGRPGSLLSIILFNSSEFLYNRLRVSQTFENMNFNSKSRLWKTYRINGQEFRKCCWSDSSKLCPLCNFPVFLQIERSPGIISTAKWCGVTMVSRLLTGQSFSCTRRWIFVCIKLSHSWFNSEAVSNNITIEIPLGREIVWVRVFFVKIFQVQWGVQVYVDLNGLITTSVFLGSSFLRWFPARWNDVLRFELKKLSGLEIYIISITHNLKDNNFNTYLYLQGGSS